MPAFCKRLVVVGVGLIGGSVALAARRMGVADEVVGVVRSESSLQRATACDVVDQITTDLTEAVSRADLVVVCTPVASIASTLLQAAGAVHQDAILTDAGSTKVTIVRDTDAGLAKLEKPPHFIGSHPLAGDHRTGPESARDDLLTGKTVVVTPTEATKEATIDQLTEFWTALGAQVSRMTPAEHDRVVARSSHLPHLVAAALASGTPAEALEFVGAGWKDTTRVAAGDAALWRDILLANEVEVGDALGDLTKELAEYSRALTARDGDRIQQLLEQGRQKRDDVGN